MQCVKLEKLEQVSETKTLAVGYWIKGVLFNEIQVGQPILVQRYIRNDTKVLGVMNTSVVKKIIPEGNGNLLIHTTNSIYRVEFLDEKEFAEEIKDIQLQVMVVAPEVAPTEN